MFDNEKVQCEADESCDKQELGKRQMAFFEAYPTSKYDSYLYNNGES